MGMVVELMRLSPDELTSARAVAALPPGVDEEEMLSDGTRRRLSIDKAWDGISFLLTGDGLLDVDDFHPLRNIYLPMERLVLDHEWSVLEPAGVVAVSAALASVSDDELRARFDPVRMSELDLYPNIWDDPSELDEYLLPYIRELREFYACAARRGDAVISILG
ncbi:YfbM family protein [Amycolatopsis rhizosphaerae]|nr:YfbM family protein [Amycolatopsis rhizosphaerae]